MEEILCIDLERWRRMIVHQVQIQFGCKVGRQVTWCRLG
jgi:hypothetical protein